MDFVLNERHSIKTTWNICQIHYNIRGQRIQNLITHWLQISSTLSHMSSKKEYNTGALL